MGKVIDLNALEKIISHAKKEHKIIVFTNGVFDLLHIGHVKQLEQSKALGDILIIGLNSDSSTKKYKGDKRPIYGEKDRAEMLAALSCVDYVVIFNEPDPINLFKTLKPNIWTKATLDPERLKKEAPYVEENGGKFVALPIEKGKSTTETIAKIIDVYKDIQS